MDLRPTPNLTESSPPTFLFFGYGAEYSLGPLCKFMSAHGDHCVEIDMLIEADVTTSLRQLIGQRLVFVTSAHPLYDWENFSYYRTDREIISALHIISTLRPMVSVYYPHDYRHPIKTEELPYLPLFDLLLWPHQSIMEGVAEAVDVERVGWIKFEDRIDPSVASIANESRAVFFLGALQHYIRAGAAALYSDYRTLFDAGVAIKLARWNDTEDLEMFLRGKGVLVYPSETNSIDVMRSNDIIITHALSSTTFEAADLGKSVIYLLDSRFDYIDPHSENVGGRQLAYVSSPEEAVAAMSVERSTAEASMLSFDFAAARRAIWQRYENAS